MRDYQEHNAKDIRDLTIYTKTIPAHPASFADFPAELHPDIRTYLTSHNIPRLYTHQAEMFEKAQTGENVVITTSTASGKTLSFLLPVLQAVLYNPLTRAIFVYPTKALAADQYRALQPVLEYFGEGRISAGVYDGDTMQAERSRIRKSANIILTNPEMLNSAFLPNHSKYGFDFIFTNLKYVVIDELHSYRGAFGAHLANIFRRVKRVCGYYRSKPQFLCSSATIANPLELSERICGEKYGRRSASSVAADLIPKLVEEDRRLFFVGITRAENDLELSWYTNPGERGVIGEPSRYLRMIPEQLLDYGNTGKQESVRSGAGTDGAGRKSDLRQLRRQVQDQIRLKREAAQKPEVVRVRHRKYGEGILVSEDEMMMEAKFEGYGRKQFLKAFGEIEILHS